MAHKLKLDQMCEFFMEKRKAGIMKILNQTNLCKIFLITLLALIYHQKNTNIEPQLQEVMKETWDGIKNIGKWKSQQILHKKLW